MSAKGDLADADHVIHLIKGKLEQFGIRMDACPPMFYPEAIHNLFIWTAKASWECWGKHGFHGEWQPGEKVAACIREQILERQKEGAGK